MNVELTDFVTVFRTGQLVQMDWASNALQEAGIPFQRREEISGGLWLAMPTAPMTGPGTWWAVIVPKSHLTEAKEVLSGLPFEQSTTPDVWDFQPKPGVKLGWQIYSGILLAAIGIGAVIWALNVFKLLR